MTPSFSALAGKAFSPESGFLAPVILARLLRKWEGDRFRWLSDPAWPVHAPVYRILQTGFLFSAKAAAPSLASSELHTEFMSAPPRRMA